MHTRWITCLAVSCLALAAPLEGQETSCTYSTCALRLDEGVFRSRVLAGDPGQTVAEVGAFGTDLEERIALPDSALVHVQRADTRFRTGTVLSLIGLAGSLYGSLAGGDLDGDRLAALIAGGTLTFAGGIVTRRGRTELNEGIWWYNREFAR